MRNIQLFLLISVFICNTVYSQSFFEGEITYSNIIESKTSRFTSDQLRQIIGSQQNYFIKGGDYKSITNGRAIELQLYNYETNRVYNKLPDADTLYWFDAALNTDDVLSYEIKRNVDSILGQPCDAVVMKTRTSITTIYYNQKYKVDVSKYSNHKYNNWAFFINLSGALPLRSVVENEQFKIESIAVEIAPKMLKRDFFIIGENTPVRKSG